MTSRSHKAQRRREGGDISMFPFLAVLICTMGALILLLVIFSHQASVQAEREAAKQHSKRKTNLVEQREDAAWRAEILKSSLQKTREKLAELRHRLGYLENDTSRLRGEVIDLAKMLQRLEKQKPTPKNTKLLHERLARLQSKIVTARRKLDEEMKKAIGKNRSYAVVPYQGPNETRRQPIYVECRADGVVLQPEGIRLKESDFVGFFGPDNPLAAALRAKAGYLQQKYRFSEEMGRPYPLLLVRQTGIESYCAAMDAMRSWDSEFGYELIEDDMKLDFNEPDMRLKQVVQREIEYARSKKRALAQAVPRLYNDPTFAQSGNGGGKQYYTVSSSKGGIVPYRGNIEDLEPTRSRRFTSRYPRYPNTARRPDDRSNPGPYGGNGLGTRPAAGTGAAGTGAAGTGAGSYPPVTSKDSPSNLGGSGLNRSGLNRSGLNRSAQNGYGGAASQNTGQAGTGQAPAWSPEPWQGSPSYGSTSTPGNGGTPGTQGSPRMLEGTTRGTGAYGAPNSQDAPRLLQPPGIGGGGNYNQGYNPNQQNRGNSFGNATSQNGTIQQPNSPGYGNRFQGTSQGQGSSNRPNGQGSSQGSSQEQFPEAPMPSINIERRHSHLSPVASANSGGSSSGSGGPPCNTGGIPSPLAVGTPGAANSTMSSQTAQTPLGIGEWQPNSGNPSGQAVQMEPRQPNPFAPAHRQRRQPPKSIAEDRGKNWCLSKESIYRVPLSRPISIECYADRLVLRPTRHGIQGTTIQLKNQTRESVNELVSAVWDRVESWGMAGQEMYWRPILSVRVHQGGESRFADVQTLFQDSGFIVEQKQDRNVRHAPSRRN